MEKETIKKLPLEFQKLNSVKKEVEIDEKKVFSEINFYQTNAVVSENFYKIISKIINLES